MYNQFFRLRENPFNVNPDPRYLFLTRQTEEAWDGLKHGIHSRKGLLLLTGEVGTGKTTLLNHLLDWLHQQRAPTAFIFNSHLEISHLFDFVLSDFAVKFDATLKDNALLRLHQWLWERYRAGDTPVVIVDEAQGLSDRVLEEIRMLLNLETSNEKLLQIVLAGQPELELRLQQPQLRQVKQRIALRYKTAALSLDEARQYVQARLHIAGAPLIFASDALDAVHFYSRGIPRVMNLLCEHALINASAEQIQPVPARFVQEVASEFQLDDGRPFAPSPSSAPGPHFGGIPAQSRFLNALVSLSTADEHAQSPASEYLGPSVIPIQRSQAAPDNVVSRVEETAAAFLHRENFQDDAANSAHLAEPSEQDPASRSANAIAPSFAPSFERSFSSPFAHAFAIRSEPPFALTPGHVIAPPSAQPFESRSTPDFATSSEPNFAARSEQSLALISEQNLARNSARALALSFELGFAASCEPLNVQATAPAAPWLTQLEARLLADWTSFFAETVNSLAAAPPDEPAPLANPPRLHLVEAKTKRALSPVANPRPAPNFQNSARLPSRLAARKSSAPGSALTQLLAVRILLVAWATKGTARLSSVATAAARSRIMAHITELSAGCRSSARSLYWEFLAWIDRCLDIAASIDWAQLQLDASRWLRQPCDPTQWRLQDVRPFHELLRFNHKKM
jgi:general secretion pathway protein A